MNVSIRFKLLIYMTVNIVLFAVLLYGSNTFFAEKYYINHKKNTLIESSQKISELIAEKRRESDFHDENLIYEINTLEKSIGGTIFIGTLDGTVYYPLSTGHSPPQRPGFITDLPNLDNEPGPPPRPDFRLPKTPKRNIQGWEPYDETSFFFITKDPNFKIETLRYQAQLDNGFVLLVWVPMTGISENASISNNFTTIIGLITIVITGIWALFISEKFTRPIMEMNKITKKMSNLDFSQTLEIGHKDEIGQLSQSINHLSYSLDKAISQLNSKNRQLEQDIDRERNLDKMRREFVSNVSHELRTPIFLIQGYAEGLKANVAKSEEKRNFYCDVIMEETDKMEGLLKDLLDLSQIESGMFPINKIDFNISSLIKDIVSKYEPILTDKNIHISIEIKEELTAHADPVRIEQIIVNFINNAIDHVDKNKVIKLTVESIGKKIRVSVYNSGSTIPDESLNKVWTSFYKIDKARTRDLGGTGLGLSVVRAIQEAHSNNFGVINRENGVDFWVEIDIKETDITDTQKEFSA
ncbi:sensor histidine kinase [Geosporobacter ferrireducens]|uniref:sensor histidine kinase n=1 Tax=Geosporobacter ferrireducens TaxID=1424294 RepID=UPI00139C3978|nr:ATP-binding protein [Geosporobacter ferrireducens]MTI54251.1 cell wall metabolism sensor histidine kinase WalK [Geosporobacter ferrireducens]